MTVCFRASNDKTKQYRPLTLLLLRDTCRECRIAMTSSRKFKIGDSQTMQGSLPAASAQSRRTRLQSASSHGLGKAVSRIVLRLGRRVFILLAVSIVVFVVLRLLPTDPTAMLLSPNAPRSELIALRHSLGFDKPMPLQYLQWLGHAVRGDFGTSLQNNQAVGPQIWAALPTTLQLLVGGLLLGVLTGIGTGIYAFKRRGTRAEAVAELGNGVAISVPDFLWGIVLILGFGIALKWLPFIGQIDSAYTVAPHTGFLLLDTLIDGQFLAFGNALMHLILPCVALGMGIAPPLMRILRSSLLDTFAEDYITAARLRGLSESQILRIHGLRNAALPTLNILAMQISLLIGGTLLIEKVFGMPGIGNLMITAISAHDLPMIQALAMIYALCVQVVNGLTDALEVVFNPRLRFQ